MGWLEWQCGVSAVARDAFARDQRPHVAQLDDALAAAATAMRCQGIDRCDGGRDLRVACGLAERDLSVIAQWSDEAFAGCPRNAP